MNNSSNAHSFSDLHRHCCFFSCCTPIPNRAIYVLLSLFFIGLAFSIFLLIVVHNAAFFVSLIFLSALVGSFLLWNTFNWRRNGALRHFLHSFPDSDLRFAREGQLVKITGVVSCGNISLESSYEKATRCVYTSTLLYEYGELGLKPADVNASYFRWRLAYSERCSTEFYITEMKSGVRAVVKAGPDCKVIPLVTEQKLVSTTRKCNSLSSPFRKWLIDRNLSAEARLLRLEEGYIKEGSCIDVIGILQRDNDDVLTVVEPSEALSTGCQWRKFLIPVDIDGLILGGGSVPNQNLVQHLQQ